MKEYDLDEVRWSIARVLKKAIGPETKQHDVADHLEHFGNSPSSEGSAILGLPGTPSLSKRGISPSDVAHIMDAETENSEYEPRHTIHGVLKDGRHFVSQFTDGMDVEYGPDHRADSFVGNENEVKQHSLYGSLSRDKEDRLDREKHRAPSVFNRS